MDASDTAVYLCPVEAACLGGVNGSRSTCAPGYSGPLCGVCVTGYYQKYNSCQKCPTKASPETIVASFAMPLLLCTVFATMFVLRSMASRGMMKIGISMMQIVATANSVYSIPWPSSFSDFLDVMKVFLVRLLMYRCAMFVVIISHFSGARLRNVIRHLCASRLTSL